ncbi:hypothetical protein GOODEAATRI_001267, partial [Goodea atripinnis]
AWYVEGHEPQEDEDCFLKNGDGGTGCSPAWPDVCGLNEGSPSLTQPRRHDSTGLHWVCSVHISLMGLDNALKLPVWVRHTMDRWSKCQNDRGQRN